MDRSRTGEFNREDSRHRASTTTAKKQATTTAKTSSTTTARYVESRFRSESSREKPATKMKASSLSVSEKGKRSFGQRLKGVDEGGKENRRLAGQVDLEKIPAREKCKSNNEQSAGGNISTLAAEALRELDHAYKLRFAKNQVLSNLARVEKKIAVLQQWERVDELKNIKLERSMRRNELIAQKLIVQIDTSLLESYAFADLSWLKYLLNDLWRSLKTNKDLLAVQYSLAEGHTTGEKESMETKLELDSLCSKLL